MNMVPIDRQLENYFYARIDSGDTLEDILEDHNLDPLDAFMILLRGGHLDVEIITSYYLESESDGETGDTD